MREIALPPMHVGKLFEYYSNGGTYHNHTHSGRLFMKNILVLTGSLLVIGAILAACSSQSTTAPASELITEASTVEQHLEPTGPELVGNVLRGGGGAGCSRNRLLIKGGFFNDDAHGCVCHFSRNVG